MSQCDRHGCEAEATVVLRFRGQFGHVHDCEQCAAVLREHADVVQSWPMPCPLKHTGKTWVDNPAALP